MPDDETSPPPDAASGQAQPPTSAEGEARRSEAKRVELLERCVVTLPLPLTLTLTLTLTLNPNPHPNPHPHPHLILTLPQPGEPQCLPQECQRARQVRLTGGVAAYKFPFSFLSAFGLRPRAEGGQVERLNPGPE